MEYQCAGGGYYPKSSAWVTLEGKIVWNYQKEVAKNAARGLIGVKGVTI